MARLTGNFAAKSGECADYPIIADHCGFNYFSGRKTHHKRDNRPYRKIDVRDHRATRPLDLPRRRSNLYKNFL